MQQSETDRAGINDSERYLGALARRSFLSLWSHQNLFREVGKELADLVVICQNIVLIFSDKKIKFHDGIELDVAWQRWYNKAVLASVKQLRRAEGWIRTQPDRIFRDAKCSDKLKIGLNSNDLEIHKIAVANGAAEACLKHFRGGSGSLVVSPSENPLNPSPFCIPNPAGEKDFVHVFDEAHLHVVMQELDTIVDFVEYLRSRRKIIANQNLVMSAGEEDLLALYSKDINEDGLHDFVTKSGESLKPGNMFVIQEGSYAAFRNRSEYKNKKIADRKSYLWDHLIEKFSKNLANGTLAPIPEQLDGLDGRFGGAELALRYMALERRLERRQHSEAILTAFDRLEESEGNRFFRAILHDDKTKETGFCVLLMKRSIVPDDVSFDEYREFRCRTLSAYTEGLLERNRHLKRMIGLATEGERDGPRTEDLVYHEPPDWTPENVTKIREIEKVFEIFQNEVSFERLSSLEYPDSIGVGPKTFSPIPYRFINSRISEMTYAERGNRRQRRKAAARSRKMRK